MNKEVKQLSCFISERDLQRSYTANFIFKRKFVSLLRYLDKIIVSRRERLLDIGCGFGGVARVIGDYLGFEQVYGVDIDEEVKGETIEKKNKF